MNGQVVSVDYALTCETALFGTLQYGDQITIGASVYKVQHEPMRIGDGTDCVVPLMYEAPVALGSLLLEDGFNLLLEDGGRLLLES